MLSFLRRNKHHTQLLTNKHLYVWPANITQDTPTSFTRRVARNLQHLLKMESYLDRVVDPAAGSYYIEELTIRMVEHCWKQLQEG